jgi:hypothetical protein
MADEVATIEKEEKQAALDFDAGFSEETARPKETVTVTPAPKPQLLTKDKVEAKKPEPASLPAKPKEPAAQPVEYVQITKEAFAALDNAAKRVPILEQRLDKAFGTMGDVQKIVRTLQAATPAGVKVEFPKDAFDEMAKDFPQLAGQMKKELERILAGVKGTAPSAEAAKAAEVDPNVLKTMIDDGVSQRYVKDQVEALDDEFPDWRKIVGQVDITKQQPDTKNPYRKWLATQPEDYQARINGTNSAAVIAASIRKFQAAAKVAAPPKKPATLKQVAHAAKMREAIQPKGDRGPVSSGHKVDEFEEGFRTG